MNEILWELLNFDYDMVSTGPLEEYGLQAVIHFENWTGIIKRRFACKNSKSSLNTRFYLRGKYFPLYKKAKHVNLRKSDPCNLIIHEKWTK